ncbi:MAG: hypothetical protein R2685_17070 [Candidatus Nitrosocosmicus sp.]|nr:hypothetical protein [Candidatus Nitrosocosmicus sp.]
MVPISINLTPSATPNMIDYSLEGADIQASTVSLLPIPSTAWNMANTLAVILDNARPINASTETISLILIIRVSEKEL